MNPGWSPSSAHRPVGFGPARGRTKGPGPRRWSIGGLPAVLVVSVVLASLPGCATAPRGVTTGPFAGIGTGWDLYAYLDFRGPEGWSEALKGALLDAAADHGLGASKSSTARALNATRAVAIGARFPMEVPARDDALGASDSPVATPDAGASGGSSFVLRAEGSYSVPFAGLSLALDPAWKRRKGVSSPYWKASGAPLSFALFGGSMAFVSDGSDPTARLGKTPTEAPASFTPTFMDAPFYGWTDSAERLLHGLVDSSLPSLSYMRFPVESAGVAARVADGRLSFELLFLAKDELGAKALAAVLRIMISVGAFRDGGAAEAGSLPRFSSAPATAGRLVSLSSESIPIGDSGPTLSKALALILSSQYIR